MKKTKIAPTQEQIIEYNIMRKNGSVSRNTNLRFGKIALATDQDLDG